MTTLIAPSEAADEVSPLIDGVDLQTILRAWNEATDRLQRTHETLREEVRRLSDELEAKNRELARRNRLADLGQMASHVAHEVRNSLVPMKLYLSLLRRRASGDDAAGSDLLDKFAAGFLALEATVSDLLNFSTERPPNCGVFQPAQMIDELCHSLAPQLVAQGIRLRRDIDASICMRADRDMVRRAVLNLLLNALDAMPSGGELVITVVRGRFGVEIEVADSGPGIEATTLKHLFEPFFTTKSSGTGLGLAIVERIAEAHGGHVLAANCPEGGAAFTVCLPSPILEKAA